MADYFVTTLGSDANAGTSPSVAWRSIAKALGSAGIASGDRVFIGAGVYRENVTVNMVSATADTQIIGDVEGIYTNTAGGEVQLTAYTVNDETAPTESAALNLSGRDFLTFKNITFIGALTVSAIVSTTTTATNINFIDCSFISGVTSSSPNIINLTIGFGATANWRIDRCLFFGNNSGQCINIVLTTGSGSDYDANIQITNCLFVIQGIGVRVTSSGTSAQEGGNVIVRNCTIFGTGCIATATLRVGGSTFTFPVKVENCLLFSRVTATAIDSSEAGNIVENYNVIWSATPRVNVSVGSQSVSDGSVAPLIHVGQELKYKGLLKPFGTPVAGSSLSIHGNRTIAPENDISQNARPKGATRIIAEGTITSAAQTSFTDNTKTFGNVNNLAGATFKITDGVGKNQFKTINGNMGSTVTGDGLWLAQPDTTSKYVIYQGHSALTSLASTGSSIMLVDNYANWGPNFWQGYTCQITSGTASGASFVVLGNSPTGLTGWNPFSITPESGDAYELFWGSGTSASGVDYIHCAAGCYESINSAVKETGTFLSGANSLRLFGPGVQDFKIPVSGSSTISVNGYFNHLYSGVKPQLIVKDGSGIGVADATGTMTVDSGIWEQLNLSFTATSAGLVTARLQSNTTGIVGSAYFDGFSVT